MGIPFLQGITQAPQMCRVRIARERGVSGFFQKSLNKPVSM